MKAISIAELEIEGRYQEARDDVLFASFGEESLGPDDRAIFPDYFVSIAPGHRAARQDAPLMQMLSTSLPVKVLVQVEDVLEEPSTGCGSLAFGVRSAQLGSTALGLNDVFVLQSASSNLHALRERIHAGMAYRGPALFSVFCPTDVPGSPLPAYMHAAAATESRAFPTLTYDPSAGPDLATCFSLEDNLQPEAVWPVEPFEYTNAALQRVTEPVAFTLADFVVCDPRHARHFARVPKEGWGTDMLPVGDWLAREPQEGIGKLPYLLAVEAHDVLHRVVVDAKVMQAARRCRESWRRIRELGGARPPHAEPPLAPQPESRDTVEREARTCASLVSAPALEPAAEPAGGATSARSRDEAYIETARCTTCEECRLIDPKMFAYNANRRTSPTSTRAPTVNWSRLPRTARWPSSTRASRSIRTSRASRSSSSARSRSGRSGQRRARQSSPCSRDQSP